MGSWRAVVCLMFLATGCCKSADSRREDPPPKPSPDPVVVSAPPKQDPAPGDKVVPADDAYAQDKDGLPVVIPTTRSKVPGLPEWNAVPREITVNRSTPLNCETKMVREWLRVSCREKNNTGGTPTNATVLRGCTPETYFFVKPEQKLASVVMPVLKGKHCEVKFEWTDKTQTLVVDWVGNGPRPTIRFEGPWP